MRFGLMHDRDQDVAGLRAEGYSFRAIAKIQGMSLGGVQRALRRTEKAPVDLDEEDDALNPLPLGEDVEPVGAMQVVGNDGLDPRIELFADEPGRWFNLLDLYRHTRVDGGVLFRDALGQRETAGRRPHAGNRRAGAP